MTNEEAIVVLQKIKPIPHRGDGKSITHTLEIIAIDMAIKALEQQPTRPTGQWERVMDYNKCSNCGKLTKFYLKYNYCPNCGARMEGE